MWRWVNPNGKHSPICVPPQDTPSPKATADTAHSARHERVNLGLARCGIVLPVSVAVGAAVPAASGGVPLGAVPAPS